MQRNFYLLEMGENFTCSNATGKVIEKMQLKVKTKIVSLMIHTFKQTKCNGILCIGEEYHDQRRSKKMGAEVMNCEDRLSRL